MLDEKIAQQFIIHLSRASRTIRMYSPAHPAVQRGAEEAYEVVHAALEQAGQITFGRRDGQLIFQERALKESTPASQKLTEQLTDLEIETVTMRRGLTTTELAELVRLIGAKSENPRQTRKEIDALPHCATNAMTYKAISAKKGEILDRLADSTLERLATLDDGQIASAMNQLATDLNRTGQVAGVDRTDKIRRQFNEASHKLVEESGLDVNDLGAAMLHMIEGLSPEVQQSLFGQTVTDAAQLDSAKVREKLEMTFKAGVMANELRRGAEGDEQWKARLDTLLKSSQDVVGLAESIASQVQLEDGQLDGDSMSRLLRLLQSQAPPEALTGRETILIADPDPHVVTQYEALLSRIGVQLLIASSGESALRMIREMSPDCVVLDAPLPELSGLDVLATMDAEGIDVPAIFYSSEPQWRDSPLVAGHPRRTYLDKPFDADAFMAAIEHHIIRHRTKKSRSSDQLRSVDPEQEREDRTRARRVQAGLLPREIPDLHGYEIGAYYNACRDVGGDYFDFFTLDDDHTGLVVADVAGKGISAAMVMCMARTVFHTLVHQTLSPRELMLKANAIIHRDLIHGMFLTAMYVVLNHRTGEVRFCSAGHNPALVYTRSYGFASFTKPSGIALGLIDNAVFGGALEESRLHLRDGDQILMYTDGVIEATSPSREEFGEQRLTQIVNANQDCSTQELLGRVIEAIKHHQGPMPQYDDITLVGLSAGRS